MNKIMENGRIESCGMLRIASGPVCAFIGISVDLDHEAVRNYWKITCPCGKTDIFPFGGLPEVDTLHSCGKPNHWVIKFEKDSAK